MTPFEANEIWIICKATCFKHNHMAQKNLFDVLNSVPAVLKFPTDDL